MQPIDQHVGRHIQQHVHIKYRDLLIKQENELNTNGFVHKLTLRETRIMVSRWISNIWQNTLKNYQHLLSSSWNHTGLSLSFDRKNDDEFEQKMLSL